MMASMRWLALGAVLLAAPAAAQNFQADNALSVFSEIVPNNTTAVQVCKSSCRVYQVDISNNSATLAYLKLYNSAAATCGSGTPQWRGMIPASSSFTTAWVNGDSYSNGVWACVTTGIADADTAAPAATAYLVNIHFKTTSQTNP
jgi:hypothetical protein